jgi:hypothetical protein
VGCLLLALGSSTSFIEALSGYLSEVLRATFRSLLPPTLPQANSSGRQRDQIVSERESSREKFDSTLGSILGKVRHGNDGLRFVDQITKCMEIAFSVGRWHKYIVASLG